MQVLAYILYRRIKIRRYVLGPADSIPSAAFQVHENTAFILRPRLSLNSLGIGQRFSARGKWAICLGIRQATYRQAGPPEPPVCNSFFFDYHAEHGLANLAIHGPQSEFWPFAILIGKVFILCRDFDATVN